MSKATLDAILGEVGSQARLAELLGTKQSTISYWVKTGLIPAEKAVELERVSGGKFPRWKSRPDLWESPSKPGRAA